MPCVSVFFFFFFLIFTTHAIFTCVSVFFYFYFIFTPVFFPLSFPSCMPTLFYKLVFIGSLLSQLAVSPLLCSLPFPFPIDSLSLTHSFFFFFFHTNSLSIFKSSSFILLPPIPFQHLYKCVFGSWILSIQLISFRNFGLFLATQAGHIF